MQVPGDFLDIEKERLPPVRSLRGTGRRLGGGVMFKTPPPESSHCGSEVISTISIYEDVGSIPGLAQWVRKPGLR